MKRRLFLQSAVALAVGSGLHAGFDRQKLKSAGDILAQAAKDGAVESSALYVRRRKQVFLQVYGQAGRQDAMFYTGFNFENDFNSSRDDIVR